MSRLGITLGIGVDVVKTSRFQRLLTTKNDLFIAKFVNRILHPQHEVPQFRQITNLNRQVVSLAGSWAAKEALFKTLDPRDQNLFQFNKWYKYNDSKGKPFIRSDEYDKKEPNDQFLLSISHDDDVLVANVLRQQIVRI